MKNELCKLNYIKDIEDKSVENEFFKMKRLRLTFKNELGMSIIQGDDSYGGAEGLYEIAIFDKDGGMMDVFNGDTVQGYLSEEQVLEYIKQYGEL